MNNIIFIAPPAAGKGTISEYLVKNYGYVHLSTGDLLRAEINSGSSLGAELKEILASGKLVSDDLIISLVESKLSSELVGKKFILDGFPRTLAQAESLDKMLITLGVTNNVVIYLDLREEDAIKRVMGRIICPKCGRSYNLYYEDLKPLQDNLCDDCKVNLETRSDDTEETFKVRFQAFVDSTTPILDYYEQSGTLKKIDVTKDINEVYREVTNLIGRDIND